MNPLRDNTQRARSVNIIFWVMLVINCVIIVSNVMQLNLLNDFKAGNIDMEAANANDLRVSALAIGNLIIIIFAIIFFIMWFRRAYNNLHLTQEVNMKYSEGWAAGWWFVPFLNLARPYEMMVEIWNKTQEATKNLLSFKKGTIVGWWWALYLISNITNNIVNRVFDGKDATSFDSLITGSYAQIIANIIEIPAIIIVILMVKQTSEMEVKLYDYHENIDSVQEDLIGVV